MRLSFLFSLLGMILLTVGCKSSKRGLQTQSGVLPPMKATELLDSLRLNQIDADWFSAKMRIDFDTPDERRKFTSYIRMRKDSIIWMNVKKVSVEAARILITPDSVYLIDRIHKEYAIAGFDLIEERLGMPLNATANLSPFQALQAMLLGNIIEPSVKWRAGADSTYYHLSADDKGLLIDYWTDKSFQPSRVGFTDLRQERKVDLDLSDYAVEEGQPPFSYHRFIQLMSPEFGEIDVDIQFSKVEFNEAKSTPFRIPVHYTEIKR